MGRVKRTLFAEKNALAIAALRMLHFESALALSANDDVYDSRRMNLKLQSLALCEIMLVVI